MPDLRTLGSLRAPLMLGLGLLVLGGPPSPATGSAAPPVDPASRVHVEARTPPRVVADPVSVTAAPPPPLQVVAPDGLEEARPGTEVPVVLLEAYRAAAAGAPPSCHLPVSLLAAIGEVESGSLSGRRLDARHRTSVLGPVLDGHGFAAVPDTDDGRLDGNTRWDRAVGPMQFLPATWRVFGVDGDGDGVAEPQDVEDAAASAASFLCYGGRDLARPDQLRTAVLAYNHSLPYQRLVLTYRSRYAEQGMDQGDGVSLPPAALPVTSGLTATALDDLWSPGDDTRARRDPAPFAEPAV
ncbi:MAG: lytic transglycosylase domain-containing protein, partial [Nocardioidaceae bacterium]